MKWVLFFPLLISSPALAQLGTWTRYTVPLELGAPTPQVPPKQNQTPSAAPAPAPAPVSIAELPDDGPLTTGSIPSSPAAAIEKPCPVEKASTASAKDRRYASLISMASETAADPAFEQAYHHLRHCFSEKQRQKVGTQGMVAGLRQNVKAHPPEKIRKDDGSLATAEDWTTVDVLARVLVGEVASTRGCGQEETNAVGKVILNRMDLVQNDTTKAWTAFADKQTGNLALNVLSKKSQFDAMKENDKANRWLACPAANVVSTFDFGGGNKFATDSGPYDKWRIALHTAVDMVFHQKKFREGTSQVTGRFYTSRGAVIDPSCKRTPAAVNGKKIDNPQCIQLFDCPKK